MRFSLSHQSGKRLLALALIACAAIVAACGGSSGSGSGGSARSGGGSKGYVAMSFGGLDIVLWDDIIKLMKPEVAARGYKLLVDDPQWKVAQQAQDWDAWIAQGNVKAIMGFPIQVNALIPVTARANSAGIKVLGYTQDWKGTEAALITHPLVDGEKLGRAAGQWIKQRFGNNPTEVAVLTDRTTDITRGRSDGLIMGVRAEAPNSIIHDVPALSREQGFNAAKQILIAHPKTRVFISFGDDAVQGAYKAVTTSGVKKDDPNYFFGSLDLTNESLDIMRIPNSIWRVGFVFTSRELAKANTELLTDAADGKPVHDYLINATQVTPATADQYYVGNRAQK